MNPRIPSIFLMLIIIGADTSTKEAALLYLEGQVVPVLPMLNLTLGFNRGVSFGLLSADGPAGWWGLVLLTFVVSMFVGWLWYRSRRPLERFAYAAILGGALGNLADRLPDGAVTDFIDLHAGGWHFPTFNLADVAISIGVVLLFVSSVFDLSSRRT
ncbi:signal peptidase II [Devosia sp. Naph2]|uniref:signal peptidase II n=1 Tax=Devosia polycyclovorans TaxID=3345148 RepID=UPI0035D04013